uniref:Uncharacterized protein n=1 Tax=Acrobeloides nanus TaxID=290746 RepID=A0A914BVI6_9BILA
MLTVEEAKSADDDTFINESFEPTSTSSLIFGEVQTIIEKFSFHLCQLQFDKAREAIDADRLVPDGHSIVSRIWPTLANSLSQMASNESVYYFLSFFTSKFSFRKENHLKMNYCQIKAELTRSIDSLEAELVPDESVSLLKQILRTLVTYLDARIDLINFYTSLQ